MTHAVAAGAFILGAMLFPASADDASETVGPTPMIAPAMPQIVSGASHAPASGPIAAAVRRSVLPSTPAPSGVRKGTWIGALIGASGAAAVTYWAAKTYGENEAGGFCEPCFVQWGAWTIPAGALVGAVIGSQLSRSIAPHHGPPSRQTLVAPIVARRGGGVVVSIRNPYLGR